MMAELACMNFVRANALRAAGCDVSLSLIARGSADPVIADSCPLAFTAMHRMKSEIRDGMRIDWNAPIEMDDGVVLRADVFRPIIEGKYPVVLSYGPYAKGLAFQ